MRARLALAALLGVSLTLGGLWLERSLGVGPAVVGAAPVPNVVSGAWFCPHGGGRGWQVWVVAANPSDRSSELTIDAHGGTTEAATATLEPRTHRYFRIEAETISAGTVVEFFGGPSAVSMVVARPDGGGVAAEPCTPRAAPRWYLPDGTSEVEGEAANVVVMNPTAADAVVDILVTTERETLRPGSLQGLVLAPGRVKGFDLNRFSLGARTVSARVTAAVGRVAVAGIGLSEGGIRAQIGVAELSRRWFLPGAGDGGRGELVVGASGTEVPFQVRAQGRREQVPALEQGTIEAGAIRTITVPTEDGALVVEAEGSVGFVAARRSSFGGAGIEEPQEAPPTPTETTTVAATPSPTPTGDAGASPGPGPTPSPTPDGRGRDRAQRRREEARPSADAVDRASTTGAPAPARVWVVPPATGPDGGPAALVIQNPGPGAVRARVMLVGSDESVREDLEEVEVAEGRVAVIDLGGVTPEPVTALVEATGGVVAAQVSLAPRAYAVSLGSPAVSVLTGSTSGISS
jgi:hypothetical protein